MAKTYTLISSNVLSSSAASVTFSSIPSTYTDLVLKCSIRNDQPVVNDQLEIMFNTSANSEHSRTQIAGNGSTATSSRSANNTYIPNYTTSANKPISGDVATETNATTTFRIGTAGLWRSASAISTIKLSMGGNSPSVLFVSGSSFYLYGIKNS